jgi:queuine tRNA-ribosyltransferase
MHISPYEKGNIFNRDPMRVRKVLMHKREIMRLLGLTKQQGYTLIPLSLYFKGSRVKMQLGLCKGKDQRDKRQDAAKRLRDLDRDGYAIGGLAVGEPTEDMYAMIEVVNDILPQNKPRYLMGVGTPWNILEGIERGVDMFDCVMPTRNGRNGMIFTQNGVMNLRNKKWEDDFTELDPCGTSFVDHHYTRAYVRHLIHAQEMLGLEILSIHNLAFYLWLVGEARKHILAGDFKAWKDDITPRLMQRM